MKCANQKPASKQEDLHLDVFTCTRGSRSLLHPTGLPCTYNRCNRTIESTSKLWNFTQPKLCAQPSNWSEALGPFPIACCKFKDCGWCKEIEANPNVGTHFGGSFLNSYSRVGPFSYSRFPDKQARRFNGLPTSNSTTNAHVLSPAIILVSASFSPLSFPLL